MEEFLFKWFFVIFPYPMESGYSTGGKLWFFVDNFQIGLFTFMINDMEGVNNFKTITYMNIFAP